MRYENVCVCGDALGDRMERKFRTRVATYSKQLVMRANQKNNFLDIV